jgi:hypothetical protein
MKLFYSVLQNMNVVRYDSSYTFIHVIGQTSVLKMNVDVNVRRTFTYRGREKEKKY